MMRSEVTLAEWVLFFMMWVCIIMAMVAYDNGVNKGRQIERQHRLERQERRLHYK